MYTMHIMYLQYIIRTNAMSIWIYMDSMYVLWDIHLMSICTMYWGEWQKNGALNPFNMTIMLVYMY